jgi:L-threonylcarbamoyladenylate synthase
MANSQFLSSCSADDIQKAAGQLKAGHLGAFPTETVYGLGADATNEVAVGRIYKAKGRPSNHPLIVHISSIEVLGIWAQEIPRYAIDLATAFWPGPMTLILNRTKVAKDFITGGQDSIGLRVPSDSVALKLLREFEFRGGLGVAAPSANRFGQVSPTSASDVEEEIGRYLEKGDLIVDGGRSSVGIESTIIDARSHAPKILRPGAVTQELINSVVKIENEVTRTSNIRVSGNFESHYAPRAKVILNQSPTAGQAMIAMSHIKTPKGVHRISSPTSIEEFAKVLYSGMRKADELGYLELCIQTPVGNGLSEAIIDRLEKSAKGRLDRI